VDNLRYIINHTKRQYVDKEVCSKSNTGWKIHPLPLLTAGSNGGGGSYYSDYGINYFGLWAGDQISVEIDLKNISQDYKEIQPGFKE
ncbi:MAG: hypothetical protein ACOCRO_02355, partial [Halanaerobiales bacterium]